MEERASADKPRPTQVLLARFSMRALLFATTLAAVALGVLASRVQEAARQEIALRKIEELGGRPFRLQEYGEHLLHVNSTTTPLRSPLYGYILGKEFFTYAPVIVISQSVTEENLRAMIPYIEQVRIKEGCNNGETYIALCFEGTPKLDADFLEYLQRRLPQCRVMPGSANASTPIGF